MHFSGWQQNGYSGFGWYFAPQPGQALSASTTRPSQGQHVHEMREVIDVTFGERSFGGCAFRVLRLIALGRLLLRQNADLAFRTPESAHAAGPRTAAVE